jgi:hypothetical protein
MQPLSKRPADRLQLDKASAVEMREFLAEMQELHPQLVMGVGSKGSLTSGIVAATVGTVVLMAILTVGPYAWQLSAADREKKPAETSEKADKPAPAVAAEPAAAEKPVAERTPPAASPDPGQPVVSAKTLERLGVDEVKQADPGVNPLDSKLDDLLDKAK